MGPRWLAVAILALAAVLTWGSPAAARTGDEPVELTIFYGDGCPYCAAELAFLEELRAATPRLEVDAYEVWHDEANRDLFVATLTELGEEPQAVPTTVVGDRVWVGFDDRIGAEIERAVGSALSGAREPEPGAASDAATVDVPLLGTVSVGDRSLVLATLAIAFVDGVNPCSLWVLSMLLALVLRGGSRRRVAVVGAVFLGVTSLMYGLYIVGFYGALSLADPIAWIQRAVAVAVGVLGALQIADALGVRGAPRVGIPQGRRPELFHRMRELAAADRGVGAALLATGGLAVAVSLMETPCTAGLPMLWTGLLAEHDVGWAGMAVLFALYLVVFLIDELLVLAVAIGTMRAFKLQERHGRDLKLVSGVVMLSLAAVLLLRPELMRSLSGAAIVLGVTAVCVAAILVVDRSLGGKAGPPRASTRVLGGR
ncbi:MAG TPA: hypothetical protein VF044_00550 [Actinomycetota bacterium]